MVIWDGRREAVGVGQRNDRVAHVQQRDQGQHRRGADMPSLAVESPSRRPSPSRHVVHRHRCHRCHRRAVHRRRAFHCRRNFHRRRRRRRRVTVS